MPDHAGRIYAFDHLRVTMTFAVLIFHSALTYIVTDLGEVWPFKDPNAKSLVFDVLTAFITSMIMPMFFIMAGFMASSLYAGRGAKQMLENRLKRLFYPLVIFLILLYPITYLIWLNLTASIAGTPSPMRWALSKFYHDQAGWRAFRPMHLWFLYYLSIFCLLTATMVSVLRSKMPAVIDFIGKAFEFIYSKKVAPVIFATVTFVLLRANHDNVIETPTTFCVNIFVLLSYMLFFGFGWMLFHQRAGLEKFKRPVVWNLLIAVLIFDAKMLVIDTKCLSTTPYEPTALAALHALVIWFLMYGLIGLFMKYRNRPSKTGDYLSNASYWIYIIHLPIILLLQGLLINVQISVYIKFLLVASITIIASLVSYHYIVRFSIIGVLLNGKRRERTE